MKKHVRIIFIFILFMTGAVFVNGQNVKFLYYGEPSYLNKIERVYLEVSEKPLLGMVFTAKNKRGETKLVPIPLKGYEFTGWYKKGDYYVVKDNVIKSRANDVVLYPKFEKKGKKVLIVIMSLLLLIPFYIGIKNQYESLLPKSLREKDEESVNKKEEIKFDVRRIIPLIVTPFVMLGMMFLIYLFVYGYGPLIKDDIIIIFLIFSTLSLIRKKEGILIWIGNQILTISVTVIVWLIFTGNSYVEMYSTLTLSQKESINYVVVFNVAIFAGLIIGLLKSLHRNYTKYRAIAWGIWIAFVIGTCLYAFNRIIMGMINNSIESYPIFNFFLIALIFSGTDLLVKVAEWINISKYRNTICYAIVIIAGIYFITVGNVKVYNTKNLNPVTIKSKIGYADRKGKIIIEPVFDDGEKFVKKFAQVKIAGYPAVINSHGQFETLPAISNKDK